MKQKKNSAPGKRSSGMPSDRTILATFKRLGLPTNSPVSYPHDGSYSKDYKRCTAFEHHDVSYSAHAGV
jgi:hypothetical protein